MYPVYPRWRGEHGFTSLNDFKFCGLSPLARGTQLDSALIITSSRFIPAGAGNTETAPAVVSCLPVYPRWRGEHSASVQAGTRYSGLSPLARGTRNIVALKEILGRFIPAGAGNTYSATFRALRAAVYPRWRGEHMKRRTNPHGVGGLSPLARGTHPHFRRYESVFRFIPAGAGNTPCQFAALPSSSVYPRWRGEHLKSGFYTLPKFGLSPLARGTR